MHSFPARRVIVPAAVLAVLAVVLIQRASAAAACTFEASSATVTVTLGPNESTTVSRQLDTIAVDGVPCVTATDTATVMNTDMIMVTGSGAGNQLTIDLSGGAFAPGMTPEADGADSEIEWTVDLGQNGTVRVLGGAGVDTISVGGGGINLNATEASGDIDVVLANAPVIELDGGTGDDQLSAAGGQGTGAATGGLTLHGDDGADTLIEGTGSDQVDGGAGTDTLDFRGSTQVDIASMATGIATVNGTSTTMFSSIENVTGSPGDDHIVGDGTANVLAGSAGADVIEGAGGDDVLSGGPGTDTVDYAGAPQGVIVDLGAGTGAGDGTDTLSEFENVSGSAFADLLTGDDNPNAITGGDGDDFVIGGLGDDQLAGGPGIDTLDFRTSIAGVQVDLELGAATGDGADTIIEFENVKGTDFADDITGDDGPNTIAARGGSDTVHGQAGADTVRGGDGMDIIFGGDDDDLLRGGTGKDQIIGGGGQDHCSGGLDPDAWVDCES
jgi:Ca2+-binding RTX toxin-like protein